MCSLVTRLSRVGERRGAGLELCLSPSIAAVHAVPLFTGVATDRWDEGQSAVDTSNTSTRHCVAIWKHWNICIKKIQVLCSHYVQMSIHTAPCSGGVQYNYSILIWTSQIRRRFFFFALVFCKGQFTTKIWVHANWLFIQDEARVQSGHAAVLQAWTRPVWRSSWENWCGLFLCVCTEQNILWCKMLLAQLLVLWVSKMMPACHCCHFICRYSLY